MNDEPIAEHMKFLTNGHVQLYPEFQDLISQKYQKNYDEGLFQNKKGDL
jgi:hypothetical protein